MGLVGQRHHKSGVVWVTVGVAGVPGGSRLNISTPDNPRGRMSRQHGRRPSSYQRPYVYTSPCSTTTLVSQERCSKTVLGIVSLDACFDFGYIYIFHISFRIVVFDATRKNLAARNLVDYCYALYFSCFHEWRDYVLGSRISTIVEKAS